MRLQANLSDFRFLHLKLCVCRVFAFSQYFSTASEQRTRHLVTFLEVSQLVKIIFDKLKTSMLEKAQRFYFFERTINLWK